MKHSRIANMDYASKKNPPKKTVLVYMRYITYKSDISLKKFCYNNTLKLVENQIKLSIQNYKE